MRGELFGPYVDVDAAEVVAPGADRHDDLFERGVAGALAQPVDRALDLTGAVHHARQRVRDGQAEIVVTVRGDDEVAFHRVDDVPDQPAVVFGHREADGVGDVQRGRPVVDRDLAHGTHEVGIGPVAVLGRELDVVEITLGPGDSHARFVHHLVGRHAELLLHVDLRSRDEDVDAGLLRVPHRLPRAVDILETGARQRGDRRAVYRLRDRLDRLEVALGRDREPGLDDVDAEARELFGDLELLGDVERDSGRLLAVPQGRVEDLDRVHLVHLWAVVVPGTSRRGLSPQRKNLRPSRHGGSSASTGGRSRLHKEEAQLGRERPLGNPCLLTHKSCQSASVDGVRQTFARLQLGCHSPPMKETARRVCENWH